MFGWLERISCAKLPLSFYENELTRRYTSLGTICDYTLVLYIVATCNELLRVISDYLPAEFGIIFDGWTLKVSIISRSLLLSGMMASKRLCSWQWHLS
ncbi:hypothetical protein PC116_g18128 [Phytophthora cactorum]|nr:hypothetical protein Pcac1_g27845 [Phytophthora cactorum]KAG2970367.1 hypothetical protein PC119_g23658 [Phytophthora cactorum]KAG4233669.1 hypothetical protein PC116_g18128 [Phytophthora cactorum]